MDVIEAQEKDKTLVNMIGSMAANKEIREKNEELEKESALFNDEKPSNVYVAPDILCTSTGA